MPGDGGRDYRKKRGYVCRAEALERSSGDGRISLSRSRIFCWILSFVRIFWTMLKRKENEGLTVY
jgi:hypothetical protein